MNEDEATIIIPVFNEDERRLVPCLTDLKVRGYKNIILAANGDIEKTLEIAENYGVTVVSSPERLGKGGSILNAAKYCKTDIIITKDVDQFPFVIPWLFTQFKESSADLLISRRQYAEDPPLKRRVASKLFRAFSKLLFGSLPDTQSGFKIIRKQLLLELGEDMKTKGYAWDVELYLKAKARGCKIIESEVSERWDPDSKINVLRDGAGMAKDMISLKLQHFKTADLGIIAVTLAAFSYMVFLSMFADYPNGRDAWFHILVARAWQQGLNGMISPVVMDINLIPYPPLFHLMLAPFTADLQTALIAAKTMQILFYPLGLLFNMLLARKYYGSKIAVTYGLLLSGTYYAFGMMQARPQSLEVMLFPIAMWALLENKVKTFVATVTATFYMHSPFCISVVCGLLFYAFRKNMKDKKVWAVALLVSPILLYQTSFIFNETVFNRWVSRGDLGIWTETVSHMENPVFWLLNDLGISIIALGLIPVMLYKWKSQSRFNKVFLFAFAGFFIFLPMMYQRVFSYAMMPFAMFTAQFVFKRSFYVRNILLAMIIVQAVMFAVMPVFWMSKPPYLEKYWIGD